MKIPYKSRFSFLPDESGRVDFTKFHWDPDFLKGITTAEREAIELHERKHREYAKHWSTEAVAAYNEATDLAINEAIKEETK